jgi:BASS family bile acid:Na+ symporter
MEAIKNLIPILLTISLAGLVLTVGMNAGKGDLLYVLRRPGLLSRAILAVLVIPPIAAAMLVWVLPLTPPVKAGIMLMAVAPVPPLVPGKVLGMGASKSYAYGVYVAMALLTVISVPLVFNLASHLFGRDDTVTVATIAGTVLTGVLIPLALGLLIRHFAPGFAAKAAPIVYKVSMALVLLAFLPIIAKVWPPMMHLIGNGTVVAMTVLVLICLAAGHLLGGPVLVDRGTLATAASVRHPGIAMALASANFGNPQVTAAILLFLMIGLVLGIVYTIWIKRSIKAQGVAPA